MKRIELYVDNNDRLSLSVFQDIESINESMILRGMDTYPYIKKIATSNIEKIYKQTNCQEMTIQYPNYIVNLNDLDKLLLKRGMGPIIKNLNEYNQIKNIKKINNQKVSRKNKYAGKRIIAGGLAFLTFAIGAYNISKKNNNDAENIPDDYSVVSLGEIPSYDEEFILEPVIEEETYKAVTIDYEDKSSLDKVFLTKEYYGEIIQEYACQYGLDPNLVLAIATQERGIHSSERDYGGATGLMQIQNSVWINETIYAYNFRTDKTEKLFVTRDLIGKLNINIKIGCMYLQNCMKYMNYNTLAAVQCYNMGYGNMQKILNAYAKDVGKSVDDILNDEYDTGWLEYRNIIAEGDKNYIEHVFSWLGPDVKVTNLKSDNSTVVYNINNKINLKQIY